MTNAAAIDEGDNMRPYVVRQGDYLAKLAYTHGFDAKAVWEHTKNAPLRHLRHSPDLLYPGDVVYLPSQAARGLPIVRGGEHSFRAQRATTSLTLSFSDEAGPLANESFVVQGDGVEQEGCSDAVGSITIDVPVTAQHVQVLFPQRKLVFPVRIGFMDPLDETTGLRKRLHHLGYLVDLDLEDPPELAQAQLTAAVAAFQRQHHIDPSGRATAETLKALRAAHGS